MIQAFLPNGVQVLNTWTNGLVTQTQAKSPGGVTLSQMSFSYDSRGRLYAASDLVGSCAQYRYDRSSNLRKVLDGRGNVTTFTYGPNDEPVGMTWPGGQSASASYSANGLLASTTDERGAYLSYAYDNADRLTSAGDVTISYDNADRPLVVTDSTGSTTFTYDPTTKRLTSVVTLLGGRNYTLSYTYYGDGKIATMTSPVGTTSYAYDAGGRLVSMTHPFNETTTWSYDHAGRLTNETTSGPGVTPISTTYTWGVSGQGGDPSTAPAYLRTITQTVGGLSFETYTLTHSYLSQLQQVTGTGVFAETDSYAYDNRGRLTADAEQVQTDGQNYQANGSYTYDLSNNLQGGVNGWTYNSNNQVTNAPAQGGLAGATGLAYDAAGNLTSCNGMGLTWDVWGRLSSVTNTPYGTVTFTYDTFGRRVSKTVSGQTTYFLYDEGSLIAELDSNGNIVRSYTWGVTGLVSDRSSGTSRFYLYDRSGNTRALLAANGTLLSSGAYTAWGSPISGNLTPNTPFGWNGRFGAYRDGETGLLLMGLRYYVPCLGRFTSRDPSGFIGGINLYGYCADDPINFFDTDGEWLHIAIGALVGGLVEGGVEGFMSWRRGEGFWKGAGRGFVKGAVVGGVGAATFGAGTALLPVTWGCAARSTVAGMMSGATSNLVGQGLERAMGQRKKFSAGELLVSTGLGGLFGRLFPSVCFAAGTPVQVVKAVAAKKGKAGAYKIVAKPIERVQVGDMVVSRNPRTGKTAFKRVLRTTKLTAYRLVKLALADCKTGKVVEVITATPNHPFYVRGKGFVPAGRLAIGNAIVTRAGPPLVVKSVAFLARPQGIPVYNFEVADSHTYFVGKAGGGVWVHNADCNPEDFISDILTWQSQNQKGEQLLTNTNTRMFCANCTRLNG